MVGARDGGINGGIGGWVNRGVGGWMGGGWVGRWMDGWITHRYTTVFIIYTYVYRYTYTQSHEFRRPSKERSSKAMQLRPYNLVTGGSGYTS